MAGLPTVEVTPTPASTIAKRLFAALFALTLAASGFLGVGVAANALLLWPTTDRGTCFAFDAHWCTSVSISRIESESGLIVPPGTAVVESSSSRNFKSGHVTAVIRLPDGADLQLRSGHDPIVEIGDDRRGAAALREHGVATIEQRWLTSLNSGPTTAIALVGEDAEGSTWAYIRVIWNG